MFFVTYWEENRHAAEDGKGGREGGGAPPPLSDPQSQADQATAEQERGGECGMHGSAGRDSLLEHGLDLAGKGKAACLFLGEEELVVDGHLEHSAGPFDELGLDAELPLDLLRQTGGAGEVVSDPAILDDNACGHDPPPFAGHYTALPPSGPPGGYPLFKMSNLLFKRGIKWRERLLGRLQVRPSPQTGQSRLGQRLDLSLEP